MSEYKCNACGYGYNADKPGCPDCAKASKPKKCRTLSGQYEKLERARACLRTKTKESQKRGDLLNHAEELLVAVVEFLNDWAKGDFELPDLAKYDAEAMAEKAEKFSRELKKHSV